MGDILERPAGRPARRPGRRELVAVVFDVDARIAEVHRTETALLRERARVVAPRPGLAELVDGLVRTGIRIAVVTCARRAWVEPFVHRMLGRRVVEALVTGDDVGRLKPDPAAFLLALRRLGLVSEDVLAIADSTVGLRAARRAALATVVVTDVGIATQDVTGAAAVLPAFAGTAPLSAARCVTEHRRWWTERA